MGEISAILFKRIYLLIPLLVLLLTGFSSNAIAGLQLSLLGIGSTSRFLSNNLGDPTFKSGAFATNFGIGAELRLSPKIGLELDAIYLNRKLKQQFNNVGTVVAEAPYFIVPLLVKFHLGKYFKTTIGAYHALGIRTVNLTDPSGNNSQVSFAEAQLDRHDTGFSLGASFEIPFKKWIHLSFEGRYQQGFKNVGTAIAPGSNVNYMDLLGIVGLKYTFHSAHSAPDATKLGERWFFFVP